jgi:hypothetical protein
MGATWRFRLVRDDGSSGFVRRADSFIGNVDDALKFSNRVFEHFNNVARRVEAWTVDPIDSSEPTGNYFGATDMKTNVIGDCSNPNSRILGGF